jgi:hypothetical protein
MPTYTFITDYIGGTYICQKEAEDLRKGCLLWKDDVSLGGYISNLNIQVFNEAFELDIDELPPQPLDTLQNVWLFSIMLNDDQLGLHIIQTDTSKQG